MRIILGLAFLLVIAVVPALIARRKGLGFWTYHAFGVIFWLAAVPVALMLNDKRQAQGESNLP